MKKGIFCGLIFALLLTNLGNAEESNSLIILSAKNQSQTEEAIRLIESLNGKVRHVFVPDVLIGYLPEGIEDKLIGKAFITEINTQHKKSIFLRRCER